jgi:hypothetical protein
MERLFPWFYEGGKQVLEQSLARFETALLLEEGAETTL